MQKYVMLQDFEDQAKAKMDANTFSYYSSGADQQYTLKANKQQFKIILIIPRVLIDVRKISLKSAFLNHHTKMPFGLAPTAMHKMAHPKGQVNTAICCKNKQICLALSTLSTTSLQQVAQYNQHGLRVFQLYITINRKITIDLIERAQKSGYSAIVLTVDAPVLGKRVSDERLKFTLPPYFELANLSKYEDQFKVEGLNQSGLLQLFSSKIDPSLSWKDVQWLVKQTKLPIILKGIMNPYDAQLAVKYGAKGIWVSNHGGRQLDTVKATIEMLPQIVNYLKLKNLRDKVEIYVDGGIRVGSDILKCLVLGADHVFIGRSQIYSNFCGGLEGMERMLQILESELKRCMQLSGVVSVTQARGIELKMPRL